MKNFLLLGLVALTAVDVVAETVFTGKTPGGASFKVVVPDAWNGDLVIWNHGLELSLEEPDLGPLADLQLAEGYAVAASSLSQIGWSLFRSDWDLAAMYWRFVFRFDWPKHVFVTGGSLGGLVTASALERGFVGNVVGALSVCGALGGSRNWDIAIDLRLSYDALCSEVPGAALPGGAEGLPKGSPLTPADVGLAVNVCTGVGLPPALRTPEQTMRLERLLAEVKLPESFLLRDMVFATTVMSDLVHDRKKLRGKIGTGNAGVVYDDPEIDATIERVEPSRTGRRRLQRNFTPRGRIRGAKVVSLHTDKDGLVVVENESEYAAVVDPWRLTTAIVVEDIPSHCGFSPSEIVAGWESLRAWVSGAPQPTAASIQASCRFLEPAFGGPCRIDPSFVIPDMDDRVPPRRAPSKTRH